MPEIRKTKDGSLTGFVPGVGIIADGQIEIPDGVVVENHNLVKVDNQTAPATPATTQPTLPQNHPPAATPPVTSLPPAAPATNAAIPANPVNEETK